MIRLMLVSALLAGMSPIASAGNAAEEPVRVEAQAADSGESALMHKKAGDQYAAQGEYRKAGADYIRALSLERTRFPEEERLRMAVTMSWGGYLKESLAELGAILSENPANAKARLHRAKVLSWTGDTRTAIEEADRILASSPDEKEALLAKGNALRYQGDCREAIPIFEKLVEREDDFDARLGLAYCRLSRGDIKVAREEAARLKPLFPHQEKEAESLVEAIGRARRPNVDFRYRYYDDSDDNRREDYAVTAGFWAAGWKFDAGFRRSDAKDPVRDDRDLELSLAAYTRLRESFGFGGGAGINWVGDRDTENVFVWHVRADAGISRASIGARAGREVFAETAQLIENRIRFTYVTPYVEYPLPRRFTFRASYSYKDYSDGNRSGDWQGSLSHSFGTGNPSITAGYRVRFLDFHRESGSGYFDPSDFLSHQGFVTLYYEKSRFYTYLEPFFGHQSFRREGTDQDDVIGGGNGLIGVRLTKNVSLEIGGEGGNYALGTAAGFNYYLVGLTLRTTF